MMARRSLLAATPLWGLLAGCSSLIPAPSTPQHLYRLTPIARTPAPLPKVGGQLLVQDATAPAGLDTTRVALSRSATTVDYFADAAWTDRAPVMVQSLIVESLETSGGITAISGDSLTLRADWVLRIELRHFEAEYRGGDPPTVRIEVNLQLVRMPERNIVAQRAVAGTAAAQRNETPAIVDAFDEANHAALADIVEWTLGTLVAAGAR